MGIDSANNPSTAGEIFDDLGPAIRLQQQMEKDGSPAGLVVASEFVQTEPEATDMVLLSNALPVERAAVYEALDIEEADEQVAQGNNRSTYVKRTAGGVATVAALAATVTVVARRHRRSHRGHYPRLKHA